MVMTVVPIPSSQTVPLVGPNMQIQYVSIYFIRVSGGERDFLSTKPVDLVESKGS